MRTNNRKLLWIIAKITLVIAAIFVLHRAGINPFWSVLALIYWKTLLKIGLALGGLMWLTNSIIN
jgi:hypothetical protein